MKLSELSTRPFSVLEEMFWGDCLCNSSNCTQAASENAYSTFAVDCDHQFCRAQPCLDGSVRRTGRVTGNAVRHGNILCKQNVQPQEASSSGASRCASPVLYSAPSRRVIASRFALDVDPSPTFIIIELCVLLMWHLFLGEYFDCMPMPLRHDPDLMPRILNRQ